MTAKPEQFPAIPMPLTRPAFDDDEIAEVRKVLASGWVTQGPAVAAFEKAFGERHQVAHALATTSCTAALHLGVLALNLQPGDEVIVPSFTWITSAHCAEYVGAKAVFCDVDPTTFNIDVKSMEAAIAPKTRAIIAVHLFGLSADMDAINAIAKKHNIAVIEDAACAIGTTYRGKPVGSLGDLGCFSFHPRKAITTGEGGMVTTQSRELANEVAAYRNHGANRTKTPTDPKPWSMGTFDHLGMNLRLSDIQAGVGLAQMRKLDALLAHRRQCAQGYHERLGGISWLRRPLEPQGYGHMYQSYVLWVREGGMEFRNKVMLHLEKEGIQTRPGTMAVHNTAFYREKYKLRPEDFPQSTACEQQTITVPIFPGMADKDLDRVAQALKSVPA